MADPVVMLPEPSSEDAEDVVWGISTAKTLWTRGERKEAILWVRRAAEAARSASQTFRATELLMYASELEDVLDTMMKAQATPGVEPPASSATGASADDSSSPEKAGSAAAPAEAGSKPAATPPSIQPP